MSDDIMYRELKPEEVPLMADIDRSEIIDGMYRIVDAALVLEDRHIEVEGWYPTEVPDHVSSITRAMEAGGAAFGAFDGAMLVGIAALNRAPVGDDPQVMQLEPLHVSARYRNMGIGRRLVTMVAERAHSLGANTLYISATPTKNTVDAYLRMGAVPLAIPDPLLWSKEPEDIHLNLALGDA